MESSLLSVLGIAGLYAVIAIYFWYGFRNSNSLWGSPQPPRQKKLFKGKTSDKGGKGHGQCS